MHKWNNLMLSFVWFGFAGLGGTKQTNLDGGKGEIVW